MLPLNVPQIETDRLILRAPGAADLPAVLDFLGSGRAQFYGGPLRGEPAWRMFAAYTGQWVFRGYGFYAITLKGSGETVGLAGPHHPEGRPEPEMSWLLASDAHEGKGYAFEACRAVLDRIFTQFGWDSVVSYVHRDNAPSRALALRLGATLDRDTPSEVPDCETFRHIPPDSDGSPEAYA